MAVLGARDIARLAYDAGFRDERLVTSVAVALAESSGRTEVVNSIGCVGLWQINRPAHQPAHPGWTQSWLQNGANNATAAFSVSAGGTNWGPWATYTSGAYKEHLSAARAGAAGVKSGPIKHGVGWITPDSDGNPDKDNPVAPDHPPKSTEDPDPRVRLGYVMVHGAKLQAEVADAVTAATLSWSTSEVTQLSLTVEDPGFKLWRSGLFEKGTAVLYREPDMGGLNMRIAGTEVSAGSAGRGGFVLTIRSEGVWKLKQRRGALVMSGASPTDFVEAECKAVGLKCVAQPSAQRKHVARDVPKKGDDLQGAAKPSSWTTFQRLATELGYYVFEFGDTVYFGKPTWLIDLDKEPVQVALPLPGAPEVWMARQIPTITQSEDAEVPVDVSGILLERSRFKECRPGGALRLRGLPPFNMKLLLQSMSLPLLGTDPLEVSAQTPVNPTPQPPPKPAKSGGGSTAGVYDDGHGTGSTAYQKGSKSALDFVNAAVSASGAAYVFGAEASSSDPTPRALDCSELVQWALGRIGISFVDGSSAQYEACTKISVADAIATRGALLHKEGHIGISMGDGRSVEARNPTDGVGIFNARDIAWTGGGLVPGLNYG